MLMCYISGNPDLAYGGSLRVRLLQPGVFAKRASMRVCSDYAAPCLRNPRRKTLQIRIVVKENYPREKEMLMCYISGNPDLNRGPQVPQTCTLTNCAIARFFRYAKVQEVYKKF